MISNLWNAYRQKQRPDGEIHKREFITTASTLVRKENIILNVQKKIGDKIKLEIPEQDTLTKKAKIFISGKNSKEAGKQKGELMQKAKALFFEKETIGEYAQKANELLSNQPAKSKPRNPSYIKKRKRITDISDQEFTDRLSSSPKKQKLLINTALGYPCTQKYFEDRVSSLVHLCRIDADLNKEDFFEGFSI